nr:hypothetical protein GCM10020063_009820 [Dactylosporangium thailandense]
MTNDREYMICAASAACDSPRVNRHVRSAAANVAAPGSGSAVDDAPDVLTHPVESTASTSSRP